MTAKVLKLRDYEPTRREPYRDTAEFEVRPPTSIIILPVYRIERNPVEDDDPPPRRRRRPF